MNMGIRKILYPIDFSRSCEQSSAFVRYVAESFKAELTVLHVAEVASQAFEMLDFPGDTSAELLAQWKDRAVRRLAGFVKQELADLNPIQVVNEGHAAHEIVAYAESHGIDLIMMPSRGLGLVRRFVLGSTTARVLHEAHGPVWTGVHTDPAAAQARIPFKQILCAVDLGAQSEATLLYAARVAAEFGASLHVVHVSPVVIAPPELASSPELTTRCAGDAEKSVIEMIARLKVDAVQVVRAGDPAEVIRDVAIEFGADLLVIARGAASAGLGRLRAHSYSIVNQAPCSVISV